MNSFSIFDNYLILKEIGQYLHPRHLFRCVLVSKKWNSTFIPQLWRNIDLKWNIDAKSLLLHRQHVTSIASFDHRFTRHMSENVILPNLLKITKGTFDEYDPINDIFLSQALNLLSHTIFLNTLFLSIPSNAPDEVMGRLPIALKRLPNLAALDLCLYSHITLEQMQHIIYNCSQCSVFHLTTSLTDQDLSDVQVERFKASMRMLTDVKFQDLRIHVLDIEHDLGIVVPLLEQSLRVESFYLFRPYKLDTLRQIPRILQDHRRRPLKFLGIDEHQEQEQHIYWMAIQSLFQAVHKGQNYLVAEDSVEPAVSPTIHFKQRALRRSSLSKDQLKGMYDSTLEILPLYFSDTLTSLELSPAPIDVFLLLLSHLPSLRTVTAKVVSYPEGQYSYMEEISRIIWPCLDLRRLDLHMRCQGAILESAKAMTCLFKTIGKLQSLEELALCSTCPILSDSFSFETETGGYLHRLKDLKKLNIFDLKMYVFPGCRFSIEDARWMVGNWTGLHQLIVPSDRIEASEMPFILDIVNLHDIILDLRY